MALTFQIQQIQGIRESLQPVAKRATAEIATIVSRELMRNLAALDHAKNVQNVFNLNGEPRPHLYQTVNSKVVKRRDDQGYVAVVGCRKVGAHISIIESGTTHRERKPREFVMDINTTPLSILGSRRGGKKGIAGHFVWVELQIQRGLADSSKRTTGVGPKLAVLESTLASTRPAIDTVIHSTVQASLP